MNWEWSWGGLWRCLCKKSLVSKTSMESYNEFDVSTKVGTHSWLVPDPCLKYLTGEIGADSFLTGNQMRGCCRRTDLQAQCPSVQRTCVFMSHRGIVLGPIHRLSWRWTVASAQKSRRHPWCLGTAVVKCIHSDKDVSKGKSAENPQEGC